MVEVEKLLTEEMKSLAEELKTLNKGTEEYDKVLAEMSKLSGVSVDVFKAVLAEKEQAARMELERDKHYLAERSQDEKQRLDEAEYKSRKNDRWANFGAQVGTASGWMLIYVLCYIIGLLFEEEGTVRSQFFRNLANKIPGFSRKG